MCIHKVEITLLDHYLLHLWLCYILYGSCWPQITVTFSFLPTTMKKKKKKKSHFPLPPEYLSGSVTSKWLVHTLPRLPHWHLQPPRCGRTRSRQADWKNQPRGQAWHLLQGEIKLEMSWQLGQCIQSQEFKPVCLSRWVAQILNQLTPT